MLKRTIRLALLAAGLAVAITPLRAEVIEQVLVKVNGDILSLSEFEKRQILEILNAKPELARSAPNSPEVLKALAEATPGLILSAVDDLLLLQKAKERGWAMSDERMKEIIAGIRRDQGLEDDATFKKALESEGLSEADLRKSLEKDILLRQVRQVEVVDKISVSAEELRAYYDEHSRDFRSPAEITLREIFIPVPTSDRGINVAQDDAARATAEQTHKKLVAGESFARLASEISASASRAEGGLVGPLKLEDLTPALQAAIEPLKIGDITEVLHSTRGYQILKLESRSDTKVRTLEEARPDVARRVAELKSRGETLKYLDRLREQANIVWRHDELKKAYEKALADRRAAQAATQARS